MTYGDPRPGTYHPPQAPPGWHPSPDGWPVMRYFDGYRWTEHTQPLPPPAAPARPDVGMAMLLPIGRSGWAIASGYLGLLSPLLVFAPFAVVTGLLAWADIRRNPHKLGRGRMVFGLVAGGLCTTAFVALLLAG